MGSKKRNYHHGNLVPVLKNAALRLIARHGVAAFKLRDAAREAGVSHAAPYRHFASREALLAAIAEDGLRDLKAALEEARASHRGNPLEAFLMTGSAFIVFAVSHPSHFRVMYGPDSPDRKAFPEIHELDLACRQEAIDALEIGQEAGLLRQGDSQELAIIMFAILYGAAGAYLDGQLARLGFPGEKAEALLQKAGLILLEGFLPR